MPQLSVRDTSIDSDENAVWRTSGCRDNSAIIMPLRYSTLAGRELEKTGACHDQT